MLTKSELIIKDRLENSLSIKKLARKYKTHTSTVTKILKDNNVFKPLSKSKVKLPEQDIIDGYNNGLNTYQLADKYNCSTSGVEKVLNRNKVEKRSRSEVYRKYTWNDNYFSKIDTANKAYFLGFIAADGCVVVGNKRSNSLQINISYKDKQILELFKEDIQYTGKIYTLPPRKRNPNKQVMIRINSDKIAKDLSKYFIVPNKTYSVQIPDIPKDLLKDYIRGYIDGDGCVSKDGRTLSISSGSKLLLEQISLYLSETLNIKRKNVNVTGNIYILSFGIKKDLKIIYSYLYNEDSLCLERKKERFSKIKHV